MSSVSETANVPLKDTAAFIKLRTRKRQARALSQSTIIGRP